MFGAALKPMLATVVVLCRNNPSELKETLNSLKGAINGLQPSYKLELLVIDGSDSNICYLVFNSVPLAGWSKRFIYRSPNGTYDAMNAAIDEVNGIWLAFMNAGDIYLNGGFASLLAYAEMNSCKQEFAHLGAVFGQAWVEHSALQLRWLTPNPLVVQLDCWLRHMVPCHQSMLFKTSFARRNPYRLDAGLKADRSVIRASLAPPAQLAHVRLPVCSYRLNGQSSRLIDWSSIVSPILTHPQRLVEIIKLFISPLGSLYPYFMRARSIWYGWIC